MMLEDNLMQETSSRSYPKQCRKCMLFQTRETYSVVIGVNQKRSLLSLRADCAGLGWSCSDRLAVPLLRDSQHPFAKRHSERDSIQGALMSWPSILIARNCRQIIFQNFYGTLIVDTIGIGLAAVGLLKPLLGSVYPRRIRVEPSF